MKCMHPTLHPTKNILIPCGHCIGCRVAKSREWSIRLTHESESWLYNQKCYITLTYNDENYDQILHKDHLRRFFLNYRKKNKRRILYYACGEYGEMQGERIYNPHFHIILFGDDFDYSDSKKRELLGYKNGRPVYTTERLRRLWKYGNAQVGTVTRTSVNYVTAYIVSKIDGRMATGVMKEQPAFAVMSKGIGLTWLFNNAEKVLKNERLNYNNSLVGIPRYYKKLLKPENKSLLQKRFLQNKLLKEKYCYVNTDGLKGRQKKMAYIGEMSLRKEQEERTAKAMTNIKKRK